MSHHDNVAGVWKDRAAAVLEGTFDAVVCLDALGAVKSLNRRAAELLGPALAIGSDAAQVLSPPGETLLRADLERLLADPAAEPVRVERAVVARTRTIVAELTIAPMTVDDCPGAAVLLRDISARRRTEGLRDVEHRLARILGGARSATEVAPTALEMLGVALEFDHAELWLVDEDAATLQLGASWRRRGRTAFADAARQLVLGRGEDVAGLVWELRETLFLDDVLDADRLMRVDAARAEDLGACAGLPVLVRGRVVAVVVLARCGSDPLDAELRSTLRAIATQFGQFAARRAAERRLAEETVALAIVSRASRRFADAVETAAVREAIVQATLDVSRAAYSFLALPDAEHGGLTVRASAPAAAGEVAARFPPDISSGVLRAFRSRRAIFISDGAPEAAPAAGDPSAPATVLSGLLQPIVRDGEAIGVVGLGWTMRRSTIHGTTRLLVRLLAAEAAIALARAELIGHLEAAARTDPLTGLANRRAWDEQLSRELAAARRAGRPVVVALLDVDALKAINDQQGHQAGDRILRACAAAWRSELREGDLLARVGGDEFAALLADCAAEAALRLCDRLREPTPEVTASLGLAQWDGVEDAAALMARADAALYGDKARARDRVDSG